MQSKTEQRITLKDGRTLGFAEYGDSNGKPVLEFHGWPSCRLEACYYDDPGKKLGARVIGIDRPGIGLSTYKSGFRILDWPSDIVEFANALGFTRFAIAGISSGSSYALACAKLIPERVTACAIVGGISPLKVEGEDIKPKQYLAPIEYLIMRLANAAPLIARMGFSYLARAIRKDPDKVLKQLMIGTPPSDLELLKDEHAKSNAQATVAESARGGSRGSIESLALQMQEWGFSVRDVTIHVTLWHGELDNVALPVAAVYLASKLPNNTLNMIPNAGHFTVVARHAEDVLRDLLRRADENFPHR
jgi:pimeloyl-ACP methyl ester carboxylesterase